MDSSRSDLGQARLAPTQDRRRQLRHRLERLRAVRRHRPLAPHEQTLLARLEAEVGRASDS